MLKLKDILLEVDDTITYVGSDHKSHRIKRTSALSYPKNHPAYLAASRSRKSVTKQKTSVASKKKSSPKGKVNRTKKTFLDVLFDIPTNRASRYDYLASRDVKSKYTAKQVLENPDKFKSIYGSDFDNIVDDIVFHHRLKLRGTDKVERSNDGKSVSYKNVQYTEMSFNQHLKILDDIGFKDDMDEKTNDALVRYGRDSSAINDYLRNGRNVSKTIRDAANTLVKNLKFYDSDDNIVLYRGVNSAGCTKLLASAILSKASGKALVDNGIISTSARRGVAAAFADTEIYPSSKAIVVRILVPRGSKIRPVPTSYDYHEQEVLLKNGTRFEVVDYHEFETISGHGGFIPGGHKKVYRDVLTLRVLP